MPDYPPPAEHPDPSKVRRQGSLDYAVPKLGDWLVVIGPGTGLAARWVGARVRLVRFSTSGQLRVQLPDGQRRNVNAECLVFPGPSSST